MNNGTCRDIYERFEEKVEMIPDGCHVWTASCNKGGYGKFSVKTHNGCKIVGAHRVAYELYNGCIPKGLHVLHHCDNACCVNPLHLYIGTDADNTRDRMERGGTTPGAKNGMSKLTEKQVREIRALYATLSETAAKYGVSISTISMINNRITWKDVDLY